MSAVRRTTTVTATALLGLALLAPTTASAVGETCRGEAATIVGTDEEYGYDTLMGTDGDDVIVSMLSWSVDAGAGDDLICLSPRDDGAVVEVDAGAGDDVVVSAGDTNNAWTDLGPGRDEFVGGGGEDRVEASLDDTIVADRGDDFVNYSIERGERLPSAVGTMTGVRDGGWIKVTAPGRRLKIDGGAGTIRLDGRVVTRFPVAPRMFFGVAQRVELIGTPGFNRLGSAACGLAIIRGRGGNDEIVALGSKATPQRECERSRRMVAYGGGGNDSIQGTKQDDELHGGTGKDVIRGYGGTDLADGGSGRDLCDAERMSGCER